MTTAISASFAWRNVELLCGQCHHFMEQSVSKNSIPAEARAQCRNPACPNFGKLFRVGKESSVPLYEITDRVAVEEMKRS